MLVTATNLVNPTIQKTGTISGYLFPDGKYYPEVQVNDTESFIRANFLPPNKTNYDLKSLFDFKEMDHSLILICGHTARDARCGQIAPLLVNEFNSVLAENNLRYSRGDVSNCQNKYEVGICSHVGGHVVSTVAILYLAWRY